MPDINLALMGVSGGGGAASTYAGPGDVVTTGWLAWWGLRGFSNAAAAPGTQKAINVRRASDSSTTDIVILPTGALDIATLTAFQVVDATGTGAITGTTLTFTGGHIGDVVTGGTTLPGTIIVSGASPTWTVNLSQTVVSATLTLTWGMFITKWYDQSGTGNDVSQATTTKQAQILLTGGPSGGVSAKFTGSASQGYATPGNIAFPTGSLSFVAIRTGNFTSIMPAVHTNGPASGFFNSANTIYWFAGLNVSVAATDSVWHAANSVFTAGAGSSINVDGTRTTGNVSSGPSSLTLEFGSGISGGQFLTGGLVEGGINTTQFSSAQQTSMNANQHGTNGWNF